MHFSFYPAVLTGCDSSRAGLSREQYRAAATALFQQQLYQEAVDLYAEYLRSPAIPAEDVPNVLYQMGTIHQENLMDPKAALAKFAVVKALYPQETFGNQLGKRMVACLEAMGRSLDASAARSRLADLNPVDTAAAAGGGAVVADLDGRKITLGEIASVVGKVPEAPLERAQLVRQYVAQILVAEAARRKGLDGKAEVKQRLRAIEDQILAQASLQEEIKLPEPSGNDLKYYFEANKARYQGADSNAAFESAAERVRADWAREKQAAAYQAYVERLLQAARVTFFDPATGSRVGGGMGAGATR